MDMIFNYFLIKIFNRIDKFKKKKIFKKNFLNSSEKGKYIVWKVVFIFQFLIAFWTKILAETKIFN
jgi:hypothetical protein